MRSFLLLFPLLFLACASSEGDGSDNGPPKNTAGTGGQAGSSGQGGAGSGGQPTAGNGSSGSAGDAGSGGSDAGAGGDAAGAGGDAAGAGGSDAGAGGASGGSAGASAGTGGASAGQGGAGGSSAGGDPFGGAGGGPEAKCDTAVLAEVGPAQPFESSADTATFSNYFGAYCDKVGASGRDTVHKLMPLADGTVTVKLEALGVGYDPVLSVTKGECTVFVTNKDGSCANYSGAGGAEELEVTVTKGSPFWVYVDGVKGADGPYLLSVQYSTGAGGAGGSSAGGSGGSAGSGAGGATGQGGAGAAGDAGAAGSGGAGEGGVGGGGAAGSSGQGGSGGVAAEGQSCDAPVVVKVEAGKPLVVQGSTAAAANNFLGYCNALNDAKDQVYEVIAGGAGKLSAKLEPLDPTLDVAIYAYKDACDGILLGSDTNGGKGACSELLGPGVAETLSPLAVTAGSKTYVYVDTNGKNGTKGGAFQLTLSLE